MDCKPIITYAGDVHLFQELEATLLQAIPKESTEWRRPYGRIIKTVYVEAKFVPFSSDILPKSEDLKLLHQPILHTYWTECADLEAYKSHVKEDIEHWQKALNGADWMLVLVEVYDIRKSNKLLPRTTVLDKIRQDFAIKQGDRVISLIHPIKSESKASESWRGLVNRVRVLLLAAYNKTLSKFEETIRKHRECRPQPSWSFCSYFLMQEELALVLEMLGLYEEALVQYDELDALFTQFILNSTKGENPKWLNSFAVPLQQWAGPTLSQKVSQNQRDLIKCSKLDLLQFRSYLFGRQCSLLLLLCKPWEMAQRTMSFLHNCVNELNILEVSSPEGAVSCWIFLVCLEVLQTCEHYNDSAQVEAYSLYTAGLWSYARDKLKELGELCGVAPGPGPTSEQLHIVVGLSSGMGDPPPAKSGQTPVDKLKEALSSKEAYNSYFLELSELSISTFKHIGRMRSARLVGADLAKFYLALGQNDKAGTFLSSALAGYVDDKWPSLTADTQLQLVDCCSSNPEDIKYIISCAAVASSDLDNATRLTYFHRFTNSLQIIAQANKSLLANLQDLGDAKTVEIKEVNQIVQGECLVEATLEFFSRLPGPVHCESVLISVEKEEGHKDEGEASHRSDDRSSKGVFKKLPMFELLDYKQDKSLNAVNIICKEPQKALRRTESHGRGRKISTPIRHDYSTCFSTSDVTLHPGLNRIPVAWKALEIGTYHTGQISISMKGVELLTLVPPGTPRFSVERQKSTVELSEAPEQLLAGLTQDMTLTVHTGSYVITEGSLLKVLCSKDLLATTSNDEEKDVMFSELSIPLPHTKPFDKISIPLRVLADLPMQRDRDPTAIHHSVVLKCTWCEEEITTALSFQAPLKSVMRLHTAMHRKFLQVSVTGLTSQKLVLSEPSLKATNTEENIVKNLNPSEGKQQNQVIGHNLCVSLLWELNISTFQNKDDAIKLEFSMQYAPISDNGNLTSQPRLYKCHFDLQSYKTLFVVRCNLEPGKDADFCRVGAMCQLSLEVTRCGSQGDTEDVSLMYEVFADQAMWAVCGRAAGVIMLEKDSKQSVALDVMPLSQGFLPLPLVRLSKYIPAVDKDSNRQETSRPRLESFSPGQVYTASKSRQVHVLPAITVD